MLKLIVLLLIEHIPGTSRESVNCAPDAMSSYCNPDFDRSAVKPMFDNLLKMSQSLYDVEVISTSP